MTAVPLLSMLMPEISKAIVRSLHVDTTSVVQLLQQSNNEVMFCHACSVVFSTYLGSWNTSYLACNLVTRLG